MSHDFRDFFRALQQHAVEFLLIGGVAYNVHAPPRATKDIDVWVRPTRENVTRLVEAIRAFGFPVEELDVDSLSAEKGQVLMLGQVPNRIDILTRPKGLVWEHAWARHEVTRYEDVDVPLLDIETLLIAKRAAGRPRDLADAAMLEKILKSGRERRS
jgi:hypothetical protein